MIDSRKLLAGLPAGLRDPLLQAHREVVQNFLERRWGPAELNGGKFCEVVYTIIDGTLSGTYAAAPSKPADMVKACRALENIPTGSHRVGQRSLRILIPRTLCALYEIRNNRGVGHVGGDVNPNLLDATIVYSMVSWILAELVRIFHNVSTTEAQETVDALSERKIPLLWEVRDVKRILEPSMGKANQALLLLHQSAGWVPEESLVKWVEYSSVNMFRKRILEPLHTQRLIEYDQEQLRAHISPTGTKKVEEYLRTRQDQ